MTEQEVAWNLDVIFPSSDDSSIKEKVAWIKEEVEKIEKKYKDKINISDFKAVDVLELIETMENFFLEFTDYARYANLKFSANMTLPENQILANNMRELFSEIQKTLAFVDLDLGKKIFNEQTLLQDSILSKYKHYLEKLMRDVPHKLSEDEEKLIIEKDKYGVSAWSQLQSQWLNTKKFEVEVKGEKKVLNYGEANGLLTHHDRATRESANKAIYTALGQDELLFSTALRNICADWVQISKKRGYEKPLDSSLSANDLSREVVENMMRIVLENASLYQRYLKIKAKILGLDKLKHFDILAPPPTKNEEKFTWDEAKRIVLEAYETFDEEYATAIKEMFTNERIDASPRYGKRNGAFCAGWYNGKSSFILQTFTGTDSDLKTLAHELGHATHNYYSFKEQSYLNSTPPLVTAETASIFGELLVVEKKLKSAENDEKKKAVLMAILDDAGRAIFEVGDRYWFEKSLYEAIEKGEFLTGDNIAKHFVEARTAMHGDVAEFDDFMKWEWTMKPHYYMPNFRFYNYPYIFGQLFVYALYQKYLTEGKEFVPKLKKLLSLGGSLSPEEMSKEVDLDISQPDFWLLGLKQYEMFVEELEKLL